MGRLDHLQQNKDHAKEVPDKPKDTDDGQRLSQQAQQYLKETIHRPQVKEPQEGQLDCGQGDVYSGRLGQIKHGRQQHEKVEDADDSRKGEAVREAEETKNGDLVHRDSKGRIDEIQMKGDAHSYKVAYDGNGNINDITMPNGHHMHRGRMGWVETDENNKPLPHQRALGQGTYTLDENGFHSKNEAPNSKLNHMLPRRN